MSELGDRVDVDMDTFNQILEMDEDPDREFSKPLVIGFFEQAWETFSEMDEALAQQNLAKLSSLGHFLKGSSATLGFTKIRDSCQVIQQYGSNLNVDGSPEVDQSVCFAKIKQALTSVKVYTTELEGVLKAFFNDDKDDKLSEKE